MFVCGSGAKCPSLVAREAEISRTPLCCPARRRRRRLRGRRPTEQGTTSAPYLPRHSEVEPGQSAAGPGGPEDTDRPFREQAVI